MFKGLGRTTFGPRTGGPLTLTELGPGPNQDEIADEPAAPTFATAETPAETTATPPAMAPPSVPPQPVAPLAEALGPNRVAFGRPAMVPPSPAQAAPFPPPPMPVPTLAAPLMAPPPAPPAPPSIPTRGRDASREADPFTVKFEALKRTIHAKLVDRLDVSKVNQSDPARLRLELKPVIEQLLDTENPMLNRVERVRLVDEILDETCGFGPLELLFKDEKIGDIMINGPKHVFIEKGGRIERSEVVFRDNEHLLQIIDRVVSRVGRRVDETCPMVDARMPNGSRFNAIIPPLALDGPVVTIRIFGSKPLGKEDLLRFKAFTPEMLALLEAAMKARLNIIISGGTGSGKTTLLNTLSSFIPDDQRVITIEDAAELQLQQEHVVRLETRPANIEGRGSVTATDLVKNALRMRPDRIIIGECRGAETLDMIQAMNTGHEGSMTTVHANTPRDALSRLETMISMAGLELPIRALRHQFASAIDLIIQANRLQGGPRKITSISEVVGMEGDTIIMQEVFAFKQLGVEQSGRAHGEFLATGIRPTFMDRLEQTGCHLPIDLFRQRVLLKD